MYAYHPSDNAIRRQCKTAPKTGCCYVICPTSLQSADRAVTHMLCSYRSSFFEQTTTSSLTKLKFIPGCRTQCTVEEMDTRVELGAHSRSSSGRCPTRAFNTGDSLSDIASRVTSKARKETANADSDMRRFPSGNRPLREPMASPRAKDVRRLQPAMSCARFPSRQTPVRQNDEYQHT